MTKNITENEIQQNNINKLVKLSKENPKLKIVPMVDGELCGYEFSYYMGSWGKPEIDEVYHEDERIYFRSYDEEELIERQADLIFDEKYPKRNELKEAESKIVFNDAEAYVENLPWEKVITLKIVMP